MAGEQNSTQSTCRAQISRYSHTQVVGGARVRVARGGVNAVCPCRALPGYIHSISHLRDDLISVEFYIFEFKL